MNKSLLFLIFSSLLVACEKIDEQIEPSIEKSEFPGFYFSEAGVNTNAKLSNYEYQTIDGKSISISNCKQALNLDISKIPEFEYFRFNLLLLSCEALEIYSKAKSSSSSYFPSGFLEKFYGQLPADVIPLLSKADKSQRQGKTLLGYDKNTSISIESPHAAKLLTNEDEIYITVLARGDFTEDGIEDLLVLTEWFAINAFGKHADLLILTKTDKDQAGVVNWRLRNSQ